MTTKFHKSLLAAIAAGCIAVPVQIMAHGDVAPHRRHAAICAGDDLFLWHDLDHVTNHLRHLLWRLDLVGCDIDHTDQQVLAFEQGQQFQRNARVDAFQ